ncbi:peptidylprolyl isomerase [Corynebacterium canis]|uniref:Peptidylprolyl isomerase n=1 Tax=Corynebacterium canis TaxID=679663 RepID=A0A5C5UEJ8_9CORY|nr:peptidylprolyl isomerase [Corynebacterium canis]TWT24197.1 peptidylprolyl isomerase [Corynebacterium canis]WJY74412.1 putative peptidyl-prolyl cis-trans isomerase [Corynebacterium canis]
MKYVPYLAVVALLLGACSTNEPGETTPDDNKCHFTETGSASREVSLPSGPSDGNATVKLATNQGEIAMNLDGSKAPCAAATIEHLAEQGFYDNTLCHRVTTQNIFILQCGDPTATGSGGPGFTFKDEYPVGTDEQGLYTAGVIAMANSGPDTNGSQFFFTYKDSPLPPNYTIVGRVAEESMPILQSIGERGAAEGARDAAPAQAVHIEKATL